MERATFEKSTDERERTTRPNLYRQYMTDLVGNPIIVAREAFERVPSVGDIFTYINAFIAVVVKVQCNTSDIVGEIIEQWDPPYE